MVFVNMKIILLKDIKSLGRTNDLIEVADGYARNSLIPRKLAIAADEKGLAVKKASDTKVQKSRAESVANVRKLENLELKFILKTGLKGEAYGSINKNDIKKELGKKGFNAVSVNLNKPIKKLGMSTVEVLLNYGIKVDLKINVITS